VPPQPRNTDRARQRVQGAVQRQQAPPGAAVLHQKIDGAAAWFAAAMPSQFETRLLIRDAQHALRTIRKLDEVDWPSLCGSLMTAAQLGLRVGVLGHSWVLPFWDSRAKHRRAQLIIGYQGYAELAHRSGLVTSTVARSVCEGDTFEVDYGTETIVHRPRLRGPSGDAYGYYAVVRFRSGGQTVWYMTREQVEEHRDRFAMAKHHETGELSGPWVSDFDAMARKTTLLQAIKYAPKTPEVAAAIAWDTNVREEQPTVAPADITTAGYIDGEVVPEPRDVEADPADVPGPVEPTPEDIAAMNAEADGA
jgi:recombination protein RecT